MISMNIKINNLPYIIDNGEKYMNTLLQELNKLPSDLMILYINSMHILYSHDGFAYYLDNVKPLLACDAINSKEFED